jgi:hypothetical protein
MGEAGKLPRIPKSDIRYVLEEIARKIERGDSLAHGDARGGGRYIERDIAVTVLRAVAEGRSATKALVGNGKLPQPRTAILQRVAAEMRKAGMGRGAQTKAFTAIAKQDGKRASAVKAEHKRAIRADRESWRREFLAGRWPGSPFWDMTEAEIDDALASQPFRIESESGAEIDPRLYYYARRDAEIANILRMTGWRSLPSRDGDK